MARVPTFDTAQVQQQPTRAVELRGVAPDSSAITDGLRSFQRGAEILVAKEREKADTALLMDADNQLTQWQQKAMYDENGGVYTKKGKNALDVTNQTLEQFDQTQAEIAKSLTSDAQRARYAQIVSSRRNSLSNDLNRYEYSERQNYYGEVEKGQIETSMQGAALDYRDPGKVDAYRQKMDAVLNSRAQRLGLAPEAAEAEKLKFNSSMNSDVLQRHANDDPYAAQKLLKQYEGSMTADDLVRVGGMIENKVDRLQQKAEMAQLRAEAKAERTLGKINAQISSGIPATDEMWKQWGSQVRGTPAQAEFNDLVRQEVDTQKILRLPIDQQIAAINAKTAKLQTEGGTIADATNLNRLSRAVDASAKMMAESPLDYFQQRLGGDISPVDLNSADLGAVLTDRVSAIQGMQQKFGSIVAMKPLLPQEAKQISAQLAEMSPEQQSQLFATLHTAMGDDKAYSGAMQQIAPDSPIRALTGLLAGKQRSMVTNTNWFKPDDVVTSGDVAKTMALGESILNKSKTEKGSDGKGASFPLPKQADFQLELNKQLGNVFAGQPQSYQLAAQAVKSYYTGAAAEKGNVSGEVDRSLLREAIKASVGEVVDFNGGETLAPWGMPGHTFRDVATERLVGTMKAQGMSEADISTADALTLRQYKDGIYYVMQGQQFKYGADGKPLMINMNEDGK
ncbi:hypothetical protein [Pseudomonas sp. VE 196-7]|uniref:hypothetical protein n=1 Tax=Pseudomonas sp. VE 196-7 TaxID=2956726 RepID=UPI0021D4D86C|nr:hypothetical protein [Pseudomonas sp. VE 196-7]MCU7218016.1 hypothetical protein [Pseudomonas sp. VE 196-7]